MLKGTNASSCILDENTRCIEEASCIEVWVEELCELPSAQCSFLVSYETEEGAPLGLFASDI